MEQVLNELAELRFDDQLAVHDLLFETLEGYDPPEGWGWCYIDEAWIDLPDQTPQIGPIPRYI